MSDDPKAAALAQLRALQALPPAQSPTSERLRKLLIAGAAVAALSVIACAQSKDKDPNNG